MPIIRAYLGRLPILGVCLGHQALGQHLGWTVKRAIPKHGKRSPIDHPGTGLFQGLPDPMEVARYHSLVVAPTPGATTTTQVLARARDDGTVMALQNQSKLAWGVQFHPESYGTQSGQRLIGNFWRLACAYAMQTT